LEQALRPVDMTHLQFVTLTLAWLKTDPRCDVPAQLERLL